MTEWVEEVAREFPPASIVHDMLAFIGGVERNPILTPARRFLSQRYVSDPEGPREPDSVVVWARQIG